jgi:hypothetical protein
VTGGSDLSRLRPGVLLSLYHLFLVVRGAIRVARIKVSDLAVDLEIVAPDVLFNFLRSAAFSFAAIARASITVAIDINLRRFL